MIIKLLREFRIRDDVLRAIDIMKNYQEEIIILESYIAEKIPTDAQEEFLKDIQFLRDETRCVIKNLDSLMLQTFDTETQAKKLTEDLYIKLHTLSQIIHRTSSEVVKYAILCSNG